MVQNRYRTPRESLRESREAMSARRSEGPPQARRRTSSCSKEPSKSKETLYKLRTSL
nr:hypothetical protein [Tanacetum cinerariifolium]